MDKKMNMYVTTLRVWDPTIEAWRITWTDPAGDHHEQQIGRREGKDIVQIGTPPDGTANALEVLRGHCRLLPLARRSAEARWGDVAARGRFPAQCVR